MNNNAVRTVFLLLCSFCIALPATAQEVRQAPRPPRDPSQQALEQFVEDLRVLWSSGLLTYDQKIDLGRICEQIEAAGEGGRTLPLSLIEAKVRLVDEIVTSRQRQEARQAAKRKRHGVNRNLLATFSMKWPEHLQAQWDQAFLEAEQDFSQERTERRTMQAQVAADVRANPSMHRKPDEPSSKNLRRDVFSRPASTELYIRQLSFTPYFGQRFDEKVLADPALSDTQRHQLGTIILAKALHKRLGDPPFVMVFHNLQLTPDQLKQVKDAFPLAEAELESALASQTVEVSHISDLHQWFRRALEREAQLDTSLTPKQKELLAVVERIREIRPTMRFGLDEIETELVFEIGKILDEFQAQIEDITKAQRGRSMVLREAVLDRDSNIFRTGMKSKRLSPAKGRIAEPSLDMLFPELCNLFPPKVANLLDSWPVRFSTEVTRGATTPESLTPLHWWRIYEIIAQRDLWDAFKDAQLTAHARLIAAMATDGKAMEMQILTQYKNNRAFYQLTEELFADPAFTPLQKLLLFEAYWNSVGPFTGYYYALDLDADVFHKRLAEMRRMLVYARSRPPQDQLVFSVSDTAERQKTSLRSVQRWTEIGGIFSEEEMKILQARHDQLMAWLDEWGRYVPPDPNKPRETTPPANELK